MAKEMKCILCDQPVAPWWYTTLHPGCKRGGTWVEDLAKFSDRLRGNRTPNCTPVDTEVQTVRQ